MGVVDVAAFFALLWEWFPEAFWPRVKHDNGTATSESVRKRVGDTKRNVGFGGIEDVADRLTFSFVWPEGLSLVWACIDDMNGILRNLPFGTARQRASWKTNGGLPLPPPPQSSSDPDEVDALMRPSDVVSYFIDRYSKMFYYNGARECHVVWDYINMTPGIKSILRAREDVRPVVWSTEDKDDLFKSDSVFSNIVGEYFADARAKELIYEYVTEELLRRFPVEGFFPEGRRLVVWGGRYRGAECPRPIYIERTLEMGGIVQPVRVLDVSNSPIAEADITIGYVASGCLEKGNVAVFSRDSDFVHVLLPVIGHRYKFADDPKENRLYFVHPVQATMVVPKERPEGDGLDEDGFPDVPSSSLGGYTTPPVGKRKKASGDDGTTEKLKATYREAIDMNSLYECVWQWIYQLHACKKCDPVDSFLVLVYAGGCDYVKNAPLVTFKTLCKVYLSKETHAKVGCICVSDGRSGRFRLDLASFERLMALSYRVFRNIPYSKLASDSYGDVRAFMVSTREANKASKNRQPPPEKVVAPRAPVDTLPPEDLAPLAARVSWTANYYRMAVIMATRRGISCRPDNGLAVDGDGVSVHGYAYSREERKYVFATKVCGRDVF